MFVSTQILGENDPIWLKQQQCSTALKPTTLMYESMAYRYSTFPFSFGSLLPQNILSKESMPFRLSLLLISSEFLWYGWYLPTFLLKGHVRKHRVSWDCGETTQESPLLRFGELRGLLRTMTGTLSTLDISNLGSSDERIAARRTRAEAKLKQDKERGVVDLLLATVARKLVFDEYDNIEYRFVYVNSQVACLFLITLDHWNVRIDRMGPEGRGWREEDQERRCCRTGVTREDWFLFQCFLSCLSYLMGTFWCLLAFES